MAAAAPDAAPLDGEQPRINRQIVTDPLTGLAIDGYDPVAYFVEGMPHAGSASYMLIWQGVPWFFVSAANRDVFARAPEIYAPQFGGYGTMALARGYLSQGNPQIYLVAGGRLYLFFSAANRDAFMLSPANAIKDAVANWGRLKADLGPVPPAPVQAPEPDGAAGAPPPDKGDAAQGLFDAAPAVDGAENAQGDTPGEGSEATPAH